MRHYLFACAPVVIRQQEIITMKHLWLNRSRNHELLLFFNGWGMNEQPFRHLDTVDVDVLMLYNYTTAVCEIKLTELIEQYDRAYVVAWSLGVWAATEALAPPLPYHVSGLAINGTLFPIDEQRGIPPVIFQATLDSWSEPARERFNRRICAGADNVFWKPETQRPIAEQRDELAVLQQRIMSRPRLNISLFSRSVIGVKDQIFKPQAQENAWRENNVPTTRIETPHYPFASCNSWREVINLGRT